MIVAAHQPNFFPWLGYFDKMIKADAFVLVDHVQFERQGFQNRTKIKTSAGEHWLTVPVMQRSRDERFIDKEIDNSRVGRLQWGRKAMMTLKYSYQSCDYFDQYEQALAAILQTDWERLDDLNHQILLFCRKALGITTPVIRSSELNIKGSKSDMVLSICKEMGASVYLSGDGASRGYLAIDEFNKEGVQIQWQNFKHPTYIQRPQGEGFIERLSVIDLLVNCGPQSGLILKNSAPAIQRPEPVLA